MTIDADHDEGEVLGGTLGGLHRGDIQRVDRAVEIWVRPEQMPNPDHYIEIDEKLLKNHYP